MKECRKCGMYNHAEITETSACPDCGAIYAKVDAQLKRTNQKPHNEKIKQIQADANKKKRVEKLEKKVESKELTKKLIQCVECGKDVSKRADKCPNCGNPIKKKTSIFTWFITIFAFFWFIGFISNADNKSNTLQANIKEPATQTSSSSVSLQLKSKADYTSDSNLICARNWTKRGELDQRMYDHCMEGQMEGYDKLKTLHAFIGEEFYSKTAYPHCVKNWSKRGVVDTRMLSHCLDQEVESVKDLQYYREQYDAEQVNKIANRALYKYGSWKMTAYSVKQAIER